MEATAAAAVKAPATAMEAASAHTASVSSASAATTSVTTTTTAATSECRSWLSQADRCQCEQDYNRFSHCAFPPLDEGRSQDIQHFRSGIIRRSKSARSKLTVSIRKPHRSSEMASSEPAHETFRRVARGERVTVDARRRQVIGCD
jgi:hypothetical protein